VGGAVRWLVDRYWKKQPGHADLSHEQFVAETDKSPGVLLGSGYIAGGAIAGNVAMASGKAPTPRYWTSPLLPLVSKRKAFAFM
jgi:uncharacterized oligopeptide transporter (OPT) family protein